MKLLGISRAVVFTIFLTAATLNASAQANSGNSNTATTRTAEKVVTQEKGTDWSWLNWLGLLGLAGLIPKKRSVEVHDSRTVREDRTTDRNTNN